MKKLLLFFLLLPVSLLWWVGNSFGLGLTHKGEFTYETYRFYQRVDKAQRQLEQNFSNELREAQELEDQEAVMRKYKILRQEFASQIAAAISRSGRYKNGAFKSREAMDGDLATRLTASYHPKALGAVKKVFADFGDLYINVTNDAQGAPQFIDLKVDRPWSGYWYPFYDRSLYEGDNAPLRKFDRMLTALGYPDSNIALSEQAKYSGFHPDSWEGFCDGWSISAILLKEPTDAITVGEVKFSISDQKALAVFAHIGYPYTTYGLKYSGDATSDGTFQDIYPEGFHRLVTKVLGDEKIPLIIDETPGVQIWNKPIFRYRWKIEQDPQKDYAMIVTAYPWLVKERWQATDLLTSMNDVIAPTYRYRLFVDKQLQRDGLFKVVAGEWIEDSYENHPGSVKYVKVGQQPRSANEVFNKYIDLYKKHFYRS
jgi:hypothetical protein